MIKLLGSCVIIMALSQISQAQVSKYIVQFKDKASNPYSLSEPSAYLSPRAIERRTRYSIPIDSTDLPITPRYIDSIRQAGNLTILNQSKWLNSVSIQCTDAAALARINSFPFVQSVSGIAPRWALPVPPVDKFGKEKEQPLPSLRETGGTPGVFDYGSSFSQVHIHNGDFLHNIGLRGQNMIIGMLDAGFNNYLSVKAFDSVRANGQILGVYDFVNRDSSVNEDNSHGMECLSTMAANIPGTFVGTAPGAGFYLFRTENASSEYPVEEHNWVCGAERIDSAGGDVISSSLGYNTFDAPFAAASHTYADMNGNTTVAAIGADLAARKGILVLNSAGNEGSDGWKFIVTPADGDSVLAVGAVTSSGIVPGFSSYGPSSDGRVKPDVASVGAGTVVQFPNNTIGTNNGTSFACPNMAGLATCLWQGFPEFNNMQIISALRQAGNQASHPDDRAGYGIPDLKKAVMNLLKEFSTASGSVSDCTVTLEWTSKDAAGMKYEIERMLPGQTSFHKIGEQAATGEVFGIRPPYQYQDDLKGFAMASYRIRQVIDTSIEGFTADYIDTVTVSTSASCIGVGARNITLFPNPAKDQFSVKTSTPSASSNLVLKIFSTAGQLVFQEKTTKIAGGFYFENISLARLAKGKYYVSVYDNNQLIGTEELIKL